jgi:hypothetical protein
MPSQAGAAAIVALGLASIALGKRHRIAGGIGVASSLAMASGLLLARNDIVPFTLGLLTIGAALEVATWLGVDSRVRSAGAVVATGSVLLFSWLMSGRPGMPEAWVPASHFALLASQLALPSLYVATAVNQAVLRRKTLTFGEILRAAGALGVGIGGAAWVFHENRTVMLGLGIASLIAGIGGYTISFRLFERNNKRNFRALATFGLFLVLTGMSLSFSRAGFWMFACVCAIACCQVAKMFRLPTLALHGMAYLLLGAAIAGVSVRLLQVLFGDPVGSVDWLASCTVLGTAVLCEAGVVKVAESGVGRWRTRISSLGIVAQIAGIVAALAVYGLWRIMPGIVPIDTLATVVLTGSSLTLAWAAMQWERRELVWLLCGVMALGAYKLATRDFMNEHNLPLVVSLFCYGGALILLPRMLRGANAAKGTS